MVCVVGRGGIVPYLTLPLPRRMSSSRASRSRARGGAATNGLRLQDIPPLTDTTNLPSPPKSTPTPRIRISKCVKGGRYKVPGEEFDEDSGDEEEHPEWFYGVVTIVRKTGCTMLFQGDDIGTRYDAHLETWDKYRVDDDEQDDFDELVFQAIEGSAKLRKAPKPARLRPDPGNNRPSKRRALRLRPDPSKRRALNPAGGEEEGPSQADARESNLNSSSEEEGPSEGDDDDTGYSDEDLVHPRGSLPHLGWQGEVSRLSCKIRREFLKAKEKKKAAAAAKAAKGRDPTKEEAVCTRCKGWSMALKNNKRRRDADPDNDSEMPDLFNDPADCKRHPKYNKNTCRHCYKKTTVYYCVTCSDPQARKKRSDKGPKGATKWGEAGYMHFCKYSGCYANHDCGNVPRRRTKAQMTSSAK